MNPLSVPEAKKLAKASNARGVVICPPFVFLADIRKLSAEIRLGVQDVFWEEKGAFTGEISAQMLKKLGVEYVILGHSERRKWLRETDEMINKKVLAALGAGLAAILCVGEPLNIRKKGLAAAKRFVKNQLQKDLKNFSSFKFKASRLIIAYEPIWAIGTGRADSPEDTAEMAKFIKKFLYSTFRIPHSFVLYGGSVNSGNAKMFLEKKEIAGALIGGASLIKEEFRKIIKIAQRL